MIIQLLLENPVQYIFQGLSTSFGLMQQKLFWAKWHVFHWTVFKKTAIAYEWFILRQKLLEGMNDSFSGFFDISFDARKVG